MHLAFRELNFRQISPLRGRVGRNWEAVAVAAGAFAKVAGISGKANAVQVGPGMSLRRGARLGSVCISRSV